MAPIEIDHVQKIYSGGVKALDDLNLEVMRASSWCSSVLPGAGSRPR